MRGPAHTQLQITFASQDTLQKSGVQHRSMTSILESLCCNLSGHRPQQRNLSRRIAESPNRRLADSQTRPHIARSVRSIRGQNAIATGPRADKTPACPLPSADASLTDPPRTHHPMPEATLADIAACRLPLESVRYSISLASRPFSTRTTPDPGRNFSTGSQSAKATIQRSRPECSQNS
jgi:hypothetical protein